MNPFNKTHTIAKAFKCAVVRALNTLLRLPARTWHVVVLTARATLPSAVRRWGNRQLESPGKRARRYLAVDQNVQGFFEELQKRQISYVVLRWFDELPVVNKSEDIDLLVADQDLEKIEDLFSADRRQQTFDVYSVSGLAGSNYLGMPYYPPALASSILENRRWQQNLFAAPDQQHHFLSLAYHLLFHKGELSSDHDYIAALTEVCPAEQSGVLDSFDTLYSYLDHAGWVPELDTQRKLAQRSPYLKSRLGVASRKRTGGDMMVFIVRDWGSSAQRMSTILGKLRSVPLEIIHVWILDDQARASAKSAVRGGNWGRGVYNTSGGEPYALVVCFDYHPEDPDDLCLKEFPYLRNAHYLVKHRIRDQLNDCVLLFNQANCLHSADDEEEAYRYVAAVYPERVQTIESDVAKRASYFIQPHPVIDLLQTHRTRAKVEKIEFEGKPAMKKTFKYGKTAFLEREVLVHDQLSRQLDLIPPLLSRGEDYFILPWYDDELRACDARARSEKLRHSGDDIVRILQFFYQQGYALIDFHPGNLLYCSKEGLKVIDFEFLYRYPRKPETFELGFDIAGVPLSFEGDLPSGHQGNGRTFRNTWEPVIGPLSHHLPRDGA